MLSFLLGAALAQDYVPGELVVVVDDRRTRRLDDPVLTLLDLDGNSWTLPLLDDGTDERDANAGDHIFVQRIETVREGSALVYIADGREGSFVPIMRDKVVLGGERRVSLRVPEEEEPDHSSLMQQLEDSDVRPELLSAGDSPDLRRWHSSSAETSLAVVGLLGLALAWLLKTRERVESALEDRPRTHRPPRWPGALGLLGAAVLTLLVWGPALPRIGQDFLGIEYVDHYGTQWFFWFVEHAWTTETGIDKTDLFFYPWGKDIYAHTGANVLDAWAALPLRLLLGSIAGYNVFVLLMHAVSVYVFYRLARLLARDRVAAAVGALLYGLQPYLLLEFQEGRPTQGITLLPLVFIGGLLLTGRQRGLLAPIVGGVAMALTGYQYWYYAIFGAMVATVHALWCIALPGKASGGRWRVLARYALMAGVAAAIVLPSVLPMLRATMGDSEVPGLLDVELWSARASPPITREGQDIGIFSWQPLRRAMGFLVIDDDANELFLAQHPAFPAVLWLGLLLWWRRPGALRRGPTLAVLAMLFVVATGPILLVGDLALPNLIYIQMVKAVGFLQRLWWPSRSLVYIVIFGSLALCSALAWLRSQSWRLQLSGFALLLVGWGANLHNAGLAPFPTWDGRVPAGYRCLAEGDDGAALIELPFAWTQAHLYFQTVHGRPLLGGMLEDNETFTPPEFTEFRQGDPMVGKLLGGDPTGFDWSEEDEQHVEELGFRYVVVQKDAWYRPEDPEGVGRLELLMETLELRFEEPIYDDARVAIYAPFGDTLPCDLQGFEQDNAPRGHTEQMQKIRELDRRRQVYQRWLKPLDES